MRQRFLGEVDVAGWTFDVTDAAGTAVGTVTTGADGRAGISVAPGTYTVTERIPDERWEVTTGDVAQTVSVAGRGAATASFGNACSVTSTPGGRTIGFWRNKNGQALLTDADFEVLTALHLRNADGSERDFAGSLSANKTALAQWLQGANATNMAYMLSAQLVATRLGVAHGFTDPNAAVSADMIVTGLVSAADAALADDANTPSGDENRVLQTQLKNLLDAVNNQQTMWIGISPIPCV